MLGEVGPGFRGACHRARIRATRWLIRATRLLKSNHAWLGAAFSLSPGPKNPAKLPKSRCGTPCLDFSGRTAITRATFGKLGGHMRNKITKLLIVVVARRTAGDG